MSPGIFLSLFLWVQTLPLSGWTINAHYLCIEFVRREAGKISPTLVGKGIERKLGKALFLLQEVSGIAHSPSWCSLWSSLLSLRLPYFCFPEMSSPRRTQNSTGRGACRRGGQTGPAGTAAVHRPQAQELCSINHCEVYSWCSSSLAVSSGSSFIMVTVQVAKSGLDLPILRLRPRGSGGGRGCEEQGSTKPSEEPPFSSPETSLSCDFSSRHDGHPHPGAGSLRSGIPLT